MTSSKTSLNISQGSVVKRLRCGRFFKSTFVANLLLSVPWKVFENRSSVVRKTWRYTLWTNLDINSLSWCTVKLSLLNNRASWNVVATSSAIFAHNHSLLFLLVQSSECVLFIVHALTKSCCSSWLWLRCWFFICDVLVRLFDRLNSVLYRNACKVEADNCSVRCDDVELVCYDVC